MDFKTKKKLKIPYTIALVVVYLVSFILVNVGFYSPVWYTSHAEDDGQPICAEVGLVSGNCRYPYFDLNTSQGDLGLVIRTTFYLVMAGICILYLSFVFLVAGLALQYLEHPIFMSFLSIVAGVLYPIAAVLILVGTIYAEASFRSQIGYAAIITTIGGALMLVCYVMLRMYRKIFKKKGKFIERISKD